MLKSREVKIGNIMIGGVNPIVVQSMTNTSTNDIDASVEQCIRIFDAGASMVRLTTQGLKEIGNLKKIKHELNRRGYKNPVIADVHYSPHVAKAAAKIVEKVRINPGNFAGFKTGRRMPHTPTEYTKELTTLREFLEPLVEICKANNTAMRIGVNHGSLSDRILSRYGDTPSGMAESAMEFIRILHNLNFHNIVVSMKSSNVRTMVYATRFLVKMMQDEDKVYPLHLGITEAGEGVDGRIKSTIGIACLLDEGIGDTVRISLTEDPEYEIPVAKRIIQFFSDRAKDLPAYIKTLNYWPSFEFKKRVSLPSENIGGYHVPVVIVSLPKLPDMKDLSIDAGYLMDEDGTLVKGNLSADFIFLRNGNLPEDELKGFHFISEYENWKSTLYPATHHYPIFDLRSYFDNSYRHAGLHFLRISASEDDKKLFELLDNDIFGVIVLELPGKDAIWNAKQYFNHLAKRNCRMPVILYKKYRSECQDDLIIKASGELGSLLLEGLGNGIWIEEEKLEVEPSFLRKIAFGILQSSGIRISKTEFISCPGCGRTLFNLQTVTNSVKSATSHLKGLKIAIMGCIVNGPGEMADADYGYIGAGPGKISLYRGKEAIKKNIPENKALEELITLIKEDGKWIENV